MVASEGSGDYISGVCNIGPAEIRKRQFTALIGLILSIISIASFKHSHVSHLARTGIFLPLMVFSIGFVQSRKRFCLAYGFMGSFNFGKSRDITRVASKEDRASDRKTAISILLQSAALAVVLTAVVVLLPL